LKKNHELMVLFLGGLKKMNAIVMIFNQHYLHDSNNILIINNKILDINGQYIMSHFFKIKYKK